MTTVAYMRVSTGQQSIDQQHDAIAAAGITPDRVFTDTASGRAGSNRPGWTECMGYLREGDHLVVVAVDRLGRSVREVATALHELTSRGVHVRSLREGVDTSTPTGRAVTSIMATIAELELELGKERRAASREARVARGLAATKPIKLDAAQQKRLLRLYQHGEPVSELTAMFGISRSTLFRTLKVLKQQPAPAWASRSDKEIKCKTMTLWSHTGDTLVVWKLDRLGRNTLHILETVKALTDRGVTLVSVSDGIDSSTPAGRMMIGVSVVRCGELGRDC
jgi:DNA invertase Pin-like site-specific DNA recombinase